MPFWIGAVLSSMQWARTPTYQAQALEKWPYCVQWKHLMWLYQPRALLLDSCKISSPLSNVVCVAPAPAAPGWTPGASTSPPPCPGSWWCLHSSLLHLSRCHTLSGHSCAAATPTSSLCWLCLCRRWSTNAAGGLPYILLPAHPALRCCKHSMGYLNQARAGGGGCMMGTPYTVPHAGALTWVVLVRCLGRSWAWHVLSPVPAAASASMQPGA